jgi:hypothetical protein
VEKPPGVEGVRDERELEPAAAKRLEQRGRVRRELPCRLPSAVLGLQKPIQLVLVELDAEVAEQLADEAGVLELLDRAGIQKNGS